MSDIGVEVREIDNPPQVLPYADVYKDQVKTLLHNVIKVEYGVDSERPDLDIIPDTYQKDNGNFWVALDKDKVIGTVGLINFGEGRGSLRRMYLDKMHRGTGVADKLVKTLLEFAREKGYKEIYLTTIEDLIAAQRFYERVGFQRIDALPEDIPDGGDTLFYKMNVPQ